MKKVLNIISTPLTLASLFLPLVLWFFAVIVVLELPPAAAAHAVSVKVFFTALMLTLVVSAFYRFRTRSYADGIIRIGIGLVLLQGLYLYGFDFSGKTAIGAGEAAKDYYEVEAGPFARTPSLLISCLQIKTGPPETAVLSLDGAEQELSKGQTISRGGYLVRLKKIARAPLFILQDRKGAELDAGYIKLDFQNPQNRFFQFPALPHLFYLSLPGTEEETWKFTGKSWKRSSGKGTPPVTGNDPEALHMTIVRGKLVIQSRDVKRGEPVAFDGYTIRFGPGAPWIDLEVLKKPSFLSLYLGFALMLVGAVIQFFLRRTA